MWRYGRRSRPYLEEIYAIRGRVEHLRGPYHDTPRHLSDRARNVRLFQRCHLAETLSRFCLRHYLSTPSLWSHFESDQAAAAFWALKRAERQRLWALRLHVPTVLQDFDPTAVDEPA